MKRVAPRASAVIQDILRRKPCALVSACEDSIGAQGSIVSGGRVKNSVLSPEVCVNSYSEEGSSIEIGSGGMGVVYRAEDTNPFFEEVVRKVGLR